jgi:hypothetical protein
MKQVSMVCQLLQEEDKNLQTNKRGWQKCGKNCRICVGINGKNINTSAEFCRVILSSGSSVFM